MKDIQDLDTARSRHVPGSGRLNRFLMTLWKLDLAKRVGNSMFGDRLSISTAVAFSKKYTKKSVVLVGSNPSGKSPDCSAFHPDTKSRQFVDKWFDKSWHIMYDNLVDFKTENNRQLSTAQIKKNLKWIVKNMEEYNRLGWKIVACGKIAAKGLTMAKVEHFEMPHPSGLCRFWNDKEAGEAKVEEMKEWVLQK